MKIGLFIPCYVDAVYPEVGIATYKLLKHLGLDVTYPEIAKMQTVAVIRAAVNIQKKHKDWKLVPEIMIPLVGDVKVLNHDCQMAKKTMDVVEFLHDVVQVKQTLGTFPHKVSLHNSCHGVRELGLSSPSEMHVNKFNKIKDLLQLVDGINIVEPERPDECCGFGGMFSVEETAVSAQMGLDKVERHIQTGAEYITGPDCSCLMHMAGVARKQGKKIEFKHVVEILATGL